MTKRKRSTFRGVHRPRWNSKPSKIDRHMLARKGVRNAGIGEA